MANRAEESRKRTEAVQMEYEQKLAEAKRYVEVKLAMIVDNMVKNEAESLLSGIYLAIDKASESGKNKICYNLDHIWENYRLGIRERFNSLNFLGFQVEGVAKEMANGVIVNVMELIRTDGYVVVDSSHHDIGRFGEDCNSSHELTISW